MINGEIQDWQLSSSSTLSTSESAWLSTCHEQYARLYQPNGRSWCAKYKTSSEWIQVDLGVVAKITGVLTQGRADGEEWVTAFLISYSLDAFNWKYAGDVYGNKRIFDGNTDSYGVHAVYMSEPLVARFVRFHTFSWNGHPSMRVEIIGCQPCKTLITQPTSTKMSASSEQPTVGRSSCRADDGLLMTGKAWCAKTNNGAQWLQFDIGPPTVVTGVVTMGRGDTGRQQWVTRYRLAYSNDSTVWKYYSDAAFLGPKEFGGNVNADIERWHFVNSPFVARFVRLYPAEWSTRISLRAGLIGCPHKGKCEGEFTRISPHIPCVENLSYKKPIWVNSFRPTHKKRRHASQAAWSRANSGFAAVGQRDVTVHVDDVSGLADSCVTLNNHHVEQPTMRIDLGRRSLIAGVFVAAVTSSTVRVPRKTGYFNDTADSARQRPFRDAMTVPAVDRFDIYVTNIVQSADSLSASNLCGSSTGGRIATTSQGHGMSLQNRSQLNVRCSSGRETNYGRYVYIQAVGLPTRDSLLRTSFSSHGRRPQFSVVICGVTVY